MVPMVSVCITWLEIAKLFSKVDDTILPFHCQCMRVPVAPDACQHLVVSTFLFASFVTL